MTRLKETIIVVTPFNNVYLTYPTKTHRMSKHRRKITDREICGMFLAYLQRNYDETGNDAVDVSDSDGTKLFTARLYKKDED